MSIKRHLRRMRAEYEKSDSLTAVLLQSKIRLHALSKLRRKQIRESIREKYPGYAIWREITEEIDEELEFMEESRKKKRIRL